MPKPDPAQSKRFIQAASDKMEDEGVSVRDASARFEQALRGVKRPPKTPKSSDR